MILEQKKTTIAYRCPDCGKAVLAPIGIFSLTGDMVKIKCQCGESEMMISRAGEGKYRIAVPCIVCPKPHIYLLSESVLFSDGLFVIPCAYTGINTVFVGNGDKVSDAINDQAAELNQMMENAGIDSFDKLREDDGWDNTSLSEVEDIVRFMLCDLDEEGKISCFCKEAGEIPYYSFQILSERVRIYCECCHAEKEIPIGSVSAAEEFLKIDSLELN